MPDVIEPKPVLHENGYWYLHWTVGRRSQRKSTGTKDYGEATRVLHETVMQMRELAAEQGSALTVAELWALYEEQHVKDKTVSSTVIKSHWRKLQIHFGGLRVSRVTQDQVDAYARKRKLGHIGRPSNSQTVRNELVILRACFSWCASPRRKLLAKRDLPDFELPASSPPRDRWLRLPEIQQLLDTAAKMRIGERLSRGERFLWLALETAARKTAILELTWDRVDFETGVIDYAVPGRRETKKRRSKPPISNALRPILERAYRDRRNEFVLDSERNIWETIAAIAKRADVPGVSPHVLRHTAATLMARRGVPIAHIADLLGNTVSVVDRTYRHHCPDATRKAVEMISGGLLQTPMLQAAE